MSQVDITKGALVMKRRDGQENTGTGSSAATAVAGGGYYGPGGADILAILLGVDGAGSLLDADLLDGNQGSFYAPIASPTFTGTVSGITAAMVGAAGLASPTFTGTVTAPILKVTTGAAAGNMLISAADGTLGYLAAGATTKILVGGGAANPVWTEATGTGAPARAGSPTFTGTVSATTIHTTTLLADHIGEHAASHNVVFDNNIMGESLESVTAFTTGFAGNGYKVIETGGTSSLEVDTLRVRGTLTAYELDINKISSVNGGMIISVANGTSLSVSGTTIYFDEDGTSKQIQFAVNDYIRAQVYTGRGIASYVGRVTAVNHSSTYGNANIVATTISGTPWNVMDLVQIGNSATASRQNLIYITAADTNNPYIDMLSGVDAGSFTGKQRLRIGNLTGITDAYLGALTGYGLWSDNVYLTGKVVLPNAGMTNEGALASSIRIYAGGAYADRATVPFRVTQDGSLTATGIAELGTAVLNIGGYLGSLAIKGGMVWENSQNSTSAVVINYDGYNGGTTQYRDLILGNGKEQEIVSFTGSTRSASFAGEIKAAGLGHIEGGLRIGTYGGLGEPGYGNLLVDGTAVIGGVCTINSTLIATDDIISNRYIHSYLGVSDTVIISYDSETSTTSTSWVKLKGITLGPDVRPNTTLRIKFDLHRNVTGPPSPAARIYKNGSLFGTVRSTNSSTYVTFSEDLAGWTAGDTVELWAAADSGFTAYLRNFRICGDQGTIVNEITGTLTY